MILIYGEVLDVNLETFGRLFGYLKKQLEYEDDNLATELGTGVKYLEVELDIEVGRRIQAKNLVIVMRKEYFQA